MYITTRNILESLRLVYHALYKSTISHRVSLSHTTCNLSIKHSLYKHMNGKFYNPNMIKAYNYEWLWICNYKIFQMPEILFQRVIYIFVKIIMFYWVTLCLCSIWYPSFVSCLIFTFVCVSLHGCNNKHFYLIMFTFYLTGWTSETAKHGAAFRSRTTSPGPPAVVGEYKLDSYSHYITFIHWAITSFILHIMLSIYRHKSWYDWFCVHTLESWARYWNSCIFNSFLFHMSFQYRLTNITRLIAKINWDTFASMFWNQINYEALFEDFLQLACFNNWNIYLILHHYNWFV